MEDRRKSKRLELSFKLFVKNISDINSEEIDVEVFDVSTVGIGFECNEVLTIGGVYEGDITLWTKDVIHAFIEIVRIEKADSTFRYGGMFIGMPEMDLKRIEIYDTVETLNKKPTMN